jgi:RNA polymerase sigma-70 factor (ECF subfamily)
MQAPDEELMLAYRNGDARAFETLYARHRAPLFRFVLRSVKLRAPTEELYQEIWMRDRGAPKLHRHAALHHLALHRRSAVPTRVVGRAGGPGAV